MNKIIVAGLAVVVAAALAFGAYYLARIPETALPEYEEVETQMPQDVESNLPAEEDLIEENQNGETVQIDEPAAAPQNEQKTIIGKSVQGREIAAYHFGGGAKEILFVGGIHGGYAWNTSLLAYQLIDQLKTNAGDIPASVKITVIPVLNPDGLAKVVDKSGPFATADVSTSADTAAARFNANNVDLNRNFDCKWQANAVWQSKTVSGGTAAFSEPESAAIRDWAQGRQLAAVVGWYSSGGGVYSASCSNGVLPQIQALTDAYAKASGYAAHSNFESYQVSGDMTDWFAKNNVPAIGVLLTYADNTEWTKNWAGCQAVINYFK